VKPSLVIIGLGNPGTSYAATRHNLGFQAVDVLQEHFGTGEWQEKEKFRSIISEARVVTVPVLLVKPQTYMNCSGEAIHKIVEFYKLDPSQKVLVICDDVDLLQGETRVRRNGGPGTHNGLKSIVDVLGEAFARLRIGLGTPPPGSDLANWVLSVPSKEEQKVFARTLQELPEIVRQYVLEENPAK
jgi:PTH1 family peptidyl-tRNA hydrolase